MVSKFEIDSYVEYLASNKLVKYFYPSAVAKHFNLSNAEVIPRLDELSKDGKLLLKFEIRCPACFSHLKTVDNFVEYIGRTFECQYCNEQFEINFDMIYPIYYISDLYRESLKKNSIDQMKMLLHKVTIANL